MPKKKSSDDPKVMDVAKPGKTAPDDTARPIIVSHKPMVKDPMMSEPAGAAGDLLPKEDGSLGMSHTGITVVPGTTPTEKSKSPAKSAAAKEETPPAVTPTEAAEPAAQSETTEPAPAESDKAITTDAKAASDASTAPQSDPAETTSADDAAAVDAVASETGAKKMEGEPTEEEIAKAAALEQLIASRQYVVPIQREKSRGASHTLAIVMLIILLVVVGAELAIDAGLIETDIPPVVDLIKN